MDRTLRFLIMAALAVSTYLLTLYILIQAPIVAIFSGSEGVTVTGTFTIRKRYWDIKIIYFKNWSPFWSLKIEVYREGYDETPVFLTSAVKFTYPSGEEKVELDSHPSLPPGRYYLKVYSKSVQWTIQIEEWD